MLFFYSIWSIQVPLKHYAIVQRSVYIFVNGQRKDRVLRFEYNKIYQFLQGLIFNWILLQTALADTVMQRFVPLCEVNCSTVSSH